MSSDTITPSTPSTAPPATRTPGAAPATTGRTRPEIDELRAVVDGTVHVPGEAAWDAARSPWAAQVAQEPLAVVEYPVAGTGYSGELVEVMAALAAGR